MRLSGLRNRKHNGSSFHTMLLLIVPKLFKKGWNVDLAILSLLSLGKARTYLWNTVPRVQKPQKVKSSRTKCLMMAYTPIYIVLLLLILSKWSMFYMNKCIYYISSPFSVFLEELLIPSFYAYYLCIWRQLYQSSLNSTNPHLPVFHDHYVFQIGP